MKQINMVLFMKDRRTLTDEEIIEKPIYNYIINILIWSEATKKKMELKYLSYALIDRKYKSIKTVNEREKFFRYKFSEIKETITDSSLIKLIDTLNPKAEISYLDELKKLPGFNENRINGNSPVSNLRRYLKQLEEHGLIKEYKITSKGKALKRIYDIKYKLDRILNCDFPRFFEIDKKGYSKQYNSALNEFIVKIIKAEKEIAKKYGVELINRK